MSIEELIHKHCQYHDVITFQDAESGSEQSGVIIGWGLNHSGLRYCIVVSGQSEKQVALYRVLSRTRSGQELQFRRSSATIEA